MKKNIKKAGKKMDKLLTGMIVGGAIGSVVGMALSPRSGKENREEVKKKAGEVMEKGMLFVEEREKELGIRPGKKECLAKRIFKLFRSK